MTTIFALFRTSKSLLILCLFALTLTTQLFSQSIVVGPPVAFVSTFSSNSIAAVDANGNATTLSPLLSLPEGIVIGPDGFIYICEPDANTIVRINQAGTVKQTVFNGALTPEGPSFSPSGDLYFNTKNHTGVYKISSTSLSSLPGNGATPTLVENSDGITFGEGTGFDINHNLLIVDRTGSKVLRFLLSSSTFDSAHTIVGVNAPIGVALNSGGDIFVADSGSQSVLRFANDGTAKGTYVRFPSASDLPFYLQFDSNDNLYVITAGSEGSSGQLWRIPPSSTTATLPAESLASFTAATGVAVVETGVSEVQPLSPTSPTQFFNGFPFQFAADFSQAVSTYGISVNGIDMIVDAQQITKDDWATRSTSAGSIFGAAGSTCIQHTGAGSNCLCYVAKCFPHGGDPSTATGAQCPTSPASDLFFTDTFTTCDTTPTNSNASFFTANEDPTVNDFQDILIPDGVSGNFTPPSGCIEDPIKGGTRGTNSIFCVAEDAPITVTITTPTGTNYTLGQSVTANYQCNTPSGPATSCVGPVPSGSNIDTSTVGSHDFTVNATNGLNTATKTVTYTVGFATSGACLLYDPTKMVKSGAVIPLKLYLCDAAGHDVSSSTIVLTAIRVQLVSVGTSDTSLLSPGNSQADNNFRYDSTLGPSGGYIFNFDTSGKHGTYNMFFTATGDPNLHSLTFQVK